MRRVAACTHVKRRFLTGAAPNLTAPNLALLFADDATTAESILARKRGIHIFSQQSLDQQCERIWEVRNSILDRDWFLICQRIQLAG